MAKAGRTGRAPLSRSGLERELLDGTRVLSSSRLRFETSLATRPCVCNNDGVWGDRLSRVTATQPATAGRRAGVTMPLRLVGGRSRKEMLVQHRCSR